MKELNATFYVITMWCCCRSRKPINECVIDLPTVYEEKVEEEDENELIQDFRPIPIAPSTILIRVSDSTKELNFKEAIPFYIRNILTNALENFMSVMGPEYKVSFTVSFGSEEEYGLLTCVKESNSTPFPSDLLEYLLSNSFNIKVNQQGLRFDFVFDQIEVTQ